MSLKLHFTNSAIQQPLEFHKFTAIHFRINHPTLFRISEWKNVCTYVNQTGLWPVAEFPFRVMKLVILTGFSSSQAFHFVRIYIFNHSNAEEHTRTMHSNSGANKPVSISGADNAAIKGLPFFPSIYVYIYVLCIIVYNVYISSVHTYVHTWHTRKRKGGISFVDHPCFIKPELCRPILVPVFSDDLVQSRVAEYSHPSPPFASTLSEKKIYSLGTSELDSFSPPFLLHPSSALSPVRLQGSSPVIRPFEIGVLVEGTSEFQARKLFLFIAPFSAGRLA